MLRRLALALVAFPISASLAGCLVSSSSRVDETGTRVSQRTLAQVEPGRTTGDWLVATLGEPTSRAAIADRPGAEVWRYDHTRTEQSSGAVFLIFGGASSRSESSRVFFELQDGVVQRSWQEG